MATKTNQTLASNGVFQWGAVFSGTVIALAISFTLAQFGAGIGLADDAPLRGEGSLASWGVIAAGIWILWVQLLASLAGGYTAGYLRVPTPELKPHDNELQDGLYGLTVWAFSTVLIFAGAGFIAAISSYIALETGMAEDQGVLSNAEQNAAVVFAFVSGATALLSAVAAWWAGTMGGEHRLNSVDFSEFLSFKK